PRALLRPALRRPPRLARRSPRSRSGLGRARRHRGGRVRRGRPRQAARGGTDRRMMDADPVEIRVLGCLVEKQRTTPDVYPLSVNALKLACNQSTNRDPVVDYDEPTIRAALDALADRRWARLASGPGSRAAKYRHLLDDALSLDDAEISLLCVLMLRGPQTPGELKQRSERLHAFESLEDLERTIDALSERGLAARLERRPGQKEQR